MKIFFVNGIRGGDEVEFAIPEITIGREDDNVLRIPTAGVSRYHARIYRNTAGEWLVGDQGSTNGVKLNRSRIVSDTVLREGDLIVMMSDGALSIAPDWLKEELALAAGEPVDKIAQRLANLSKRNERGRGDDITVMAARIVRA